MRKYLFYMMAVLPCSALIASCSSDEEVVEIGEAKRVVNMLQEPNPIQLTEAQKVFVNDNNQFTLNFLKTANQADRSGKSFIYSPLSITYVLGMVNDAAEGTTEQELEQTLGFHEGGIQAVNDYCKTLIDKLPKVDEKVQLNMANAIFVNKAKATLKAQFLNDMQQYYDAKAENLDFSASSTLGHINGWCNEKTNGMIKSILDKVNANTVSYLLNAIYFKADWASKFDPKNTKKENFNTAGGNVALPMMHQNVLISYMKNDTYSAVVIPYGAGLWNMTVMLPEEGKTTDDVINKIVVNDHVLNNQGWCDAFSDYTFTGHELDLKLPHFETMSDTESFGSNGLVNLLMQMGIRQVFSPDMAQIPNMCENGNVYVSMMRQKAAIKVDEEGSEAAAVTVAGMDFTSSTGEYPKATFHANRPFVYVIRESSSGVILFVGKFTGR